MKIEPLTEMIIKIDNDPRKDLELFEHLDSIPLVKYIVEEENSIIRVTGNLEFVFLLKGNESENEDKRSELYNYYIDNDYIYIRVWNIETREWDTIDYLKYWELKIHEKYNVYNFKPIFGNSSLDLNYYSEDIKLSSDDFFGDMLNYFGYKKL